MSATTDVRRTGHPWHEDSHVYETHFASIGGPDFVVRESPVFRVGDRAGGFRFNVQVVQAEVVQCGIGIRADVERLASRRLP